MIFKLILVATMALGTIGNGQSLTKKNTLLYFGPMSMFSNMNFFFGYNYLRTVTKGDLYIIIHSDGGELEAAMDAIAVLKEDKNAHAVIILAASGAAAISQNVGGETFIVPKGQLMFHEVKVYTDGGISQADAEIMAAELKKSNELFGQACNAKMKLSDYPSRVKKDWWLMAPEAIRIGAAKKSHVSCSKEMKALNIVVPTFDYISGVRTLINFCNLL